MGQRLGQGQRLLAPPHGLRRIAQAPQRIGPKGQAHYPRRLVMAVRQSALRHRVDEGDPVLEVRPGGGIVAQVE
jgi:hypothetical protein